MLRTIATAILCIGLVSPALAVDNGPSSATLEQARANIDMGDFRGAIAVLQDVIADNPSNADAFSLMGYSLRKSGNTDRALGFYLKALKINPRHRGANEYLGELYVEIGQIDKAKERLKVLEEICGKTCEEYEDLAEALASL